MARQRYDIGSKWLLQNQGKGVLLVGGLSNVRCTEPMPGELVQNRRFPDGLLRAFLGNAPKAHHVLIEIATYPERRALKQAMDDITLAYSALGHLPELLMLVLRPKGKFRVSSEHAIQSELGLTSLAVKWRTIELWTLPAKRFLAQADVGVLPWVPLMEMDGPPRPIVEQCVERIEREADPGQQGDMLAITEVMTGLRFPGSELVSLFQGKHAMIESPVVQRWKSEGAQDLILAMLKKRFKTVPRDLTKSLRAIQDEEKLAALSFRASDCKDLDAFRQALGSGG
jgi:hypothetical protein